ncbi:hypothetical protein GGS21DRAFT_8592 [Xylaria nigripes]|nr:hypothetical protein GGS21DRAFT_8592 [Xylaria nigripes]
MRLLWYAGISTALATGVVAYAFNQRANFYSAMVYLSQNNLSLMILVNLVLLIYASFVWGLQRLCYGPLRPVEIEQLYEKAWFAVTETCLAMTIFREEVGGWFLVMFTALVTGKVWEWIGEGRVEVLEQQPPANPRLFHSRLIVSLLLSVAYDTWLLYYAVNTVIQQARPNMMVMFLFEFAVLATCSSRTFCRYLLSLREASIVKMQTRTRLEERRRLAREQRNDVLRRRESDDDSEAEAARQEELPDEDDIDELDIEVPGWESKGHWILSLDLMTDFVKLVIYSIFFGILLMFYGLPIHIMRDVFMTARSFVKRLGALMRYRKALQDMSRYSDATQEDLAREDTCIICREDMRPWDPSAVGAIERSRPKKLPCGHILHFGCLKGWLERQQVCPTCRRSVVLDGTVSDNAGAAPGPNAGGQPQPPAPAAIGGGAGAVGGGGGEGVGEGAADGAGAGIRDNANQQPHRRGNLRVFQLGPIRLGFAQGNAQDIHDLANQLRLPPEGGNQPMTPATVPTPAPPAQLASFNHTSGSMEIIQAQLEDITARIQQEMNALQTTQAELQTLYALTVELNRLRQIQPHVSNGIGIQSGQASVNTLQQPHIPNSTLYVPPSTFTRHGGAPYASAIPSGSQELPEGVSIPPGWSLLPLQRLDGQTRPQHTGTQPTRTASPQEPQHQSHQIVPPFNRNYLARNPNGSANSFTPSAETHTFVRNSDVQSVVNGTSESSPRIPREAPSVAAPTPIIPQWGGSSQLLSENRGGSSTAPTLGNPSSRSEVLPESGSRAFDSSDSDDGKSDASSGKGKARAVTVEEAEEDESD